MPSHQYYIRRACEFFFDLNNLMRKAFYHFYFRLNSILLQEISPSLRPGNRILAVNAAIDVHLKDTYQVTSLSLKPVSVVPCVLVHTLQKGRFELAVFSHPELSYKAITDTSFLQLIGEKVQTVIFVTTYGKLDTFVSQNGAISPSGWIRDTVQFLHTYGFFEIELVNADRKCVTRRHQVFGFYLYKNVSLISKTEITQHFCRVGELCIIARKLPKYHFLSETKDRT